jgi:hypothetical protein
MGLAAAAVMSDRAHGLTQATEGRMVNSTAARTAAHAGVKPLPGFGPLWRALAAVIVAAPLCGCLWEVADLHAPAAEAAAPPAPRGACPSQNFPAFLDAFGESVEVQRGYTRIPLEYGQSSGGMNGTPREKEVLKTRTINSFDAIPISDGKDGGRILRSKAKRRERGLKLTVEPDGDDATRKTATIVLPGTRFRLDFHFVSTDTCWELVRIDDRTT